jgi:hypothetical protein
MILDAPWWTGCRARMTNTLVFALLKSFEGGNQAVRDGDALQSDEDVIDE